MAKDIFDSILRKEYEELSTKELNELNAFCRSEEEFKAMKAVLIHTQGISNGPKLTAQETTKTQLDKAFSQKFGTYKNSSFAHWKNVLQVAAVCAIGFAIWIFVNKAKAPEKNQLALKNTVKEETQVERKTTAPVEIEKNETINRINNTKNTNEIPLKIDSKVDLENIVIENDTPIAPKSESIAPVATFDAMSISHEEVAKTATVAKKASPNNEIERAASPQKQSFKTFSTPASSIDDISIDPSKGPLKTTVVVSTSFSDQKSVYHLLQSKF